MSKRLLILPAALMCLAFGFCKSKKAQPALTAHQPQVQETSNSPATGLNLGNQAPEISLKDPSGKLITLSSLKGKVVLIDFWASWCGPCRFENPTVVKAYQLYKDKDLRGGKGFTIYSVSLDADLNAWKKAITKDSLSWDHHVSDLKGWNNEAAARYGVTGIPMNFLVNESGIIINRNLRGKDLLNALKELAK